MNCPNCGDQARDEYANYCSTCGNRLTLAKNRSASQIAAGVLMILASSMTVALGWLFFAPFLLSFGVRAFAFYGIIFAVSIFDFVAFFFGLVSGIFILRRKHFSLSLIGVSLVMVSAFISIVYSVIPTISGIAFGMPVLALSVLALIFTAISRKEFI